MYSSASPRLGGEVLLQFNLLDHTDPVTVIEIPVGEFRDKRKHLIRKSTDVQNVATLLRLRVSVRLDIDTHELRIAVTRLEFVPLPHRLRTAVPGTRCVN